MLRRSFELISGIYSGLYSKPEAATMDVTKQDGFGKPPHCSRYNTRSSARLLKSKGEVSTSEPQTEPMVLDEVLQLQESRSGAVTRMQKRKVESVENLALRQSPVAGMIKKAKSNEASCSIDDRTWSQASEAGSVVTSELTHTHSTPSTRAFDLNGGRSTRMSSNADPSSTVISSDFSFDGSRNINYNSESCTAKLKPLDCLLVEIDKEDVSCREELDDYEDGEDGSVSLGSVYLTEIHTDSYHFAGFTHQSRRDDRAHLSCANWNSREAEVPVSYVEIDYLTSEFMQPVSSSQVCGVYERDIYENLRRRESKRNVVWGYLETHQKDLTVHHRRVMVNWLAEFTEEFGFQLETLFLGVAILDAYLIRGPPVERSTLQLLGIASMLVAVKFEEAQPPRLLQVFCEVAEKSFTQEQVIAMEANVLKTIGYQCAIPTASTFIWRCLKAAGADRHMEKLAEYLISLTLTDYSFLRFQPSVIASSAVLLAGHILGKEPWSPLLEDWTGYKPSDLREAVEDLSMLHKRTCEIDAPDCLSSIKRKFLKEENLQAACTIPCDVLPGCLFPEMCQLMS